MRRRRSIAGVIVLVVLRAASASAQEFQFKIANESEFNSNYLALESNERASFRNLIGPSISLRDPHGRLTYSIAYLGQYSWYIEPWDSRLNAWEQSLLLTSSYAFTRKTQLTVTNSFRDLASIRFGTIDGDGDAPDAGAVDSLDAGQNRFKRNSFGFELEHRFAPRFAAVLSGTHDWIDYDRNLNQADSTSMGLQGFLQYSLSARDRAGIGVGYVYQSFDAQLNTPGSRGQIWNAQVSYSRRFNDDWRVNLSGGPTFIETEAQNVVPTSNYRVELDGSNQFVFPTSGSCAPATPPLPAGQFFENGCPGRTTTVPANFAGVNLPFRTVASGNETDVTFFARMSVTKEWQDWSFTALYNRTQSNAAGDGGTSTLDRVSLRVQYDPNRTWDLYGLVGWNRRERATNPIFAQDFIVVDDGGLARRIQAEAGFDSRQVDTDQVSAILGANRAFSRKLFGRFEFRYRYQFRRRIATNRDSAFGAHFFILNARFDYSLAPIHL